MHEHQVDVGGHIQLAPAQLAHRDHDQLALLEPLERRAQAGVGEIAHRGADFRQVRRAFEIPRQRAQQHALAQAPQAALERGFVVGAKTGERAAHLRGAERLAGSAFQVHLGGEFRMRGEACLGVARKGDFPNRIRHLQLEYRSFPKRDANPV